MKHTTPYTVHIDTLIEMALKLNGEDQSNTAKAARSAGLSSKAEKHNDVSLDCKPSIGICTEYRPVIDYVYY